MWCVVDNQTDIVKVLSKHKTCGVEMGERYTKRGSAVLLAGNIGRVTLSARNRHGYGDMLRVSARLPGDSAPQRKAALQWLNLFAGVAPTLLQVGPEFAPAGMTLINATTFITCHLE